ncbi:UNVERIFIED_CONTAM: hypothetical protein HDU68_000202 [Siphonaria sp. JEL0065]|nr:hypothetical protein HDU68_000202 [Siphonaria sp. JEL0065]
MPAKKRGPKRGYKEELMERMANIEAMVRTTPTGGSASSSGMSGMGNNDPNSLEYCQMDFSRQPRRGSSSSTVTAISDHQQHQHHSHQLLDPMELLVREATRVGTVQTHSSDPNPAIFMPQGLGTPLQINNDMSSRSSNLGIMNQMVDHDYHTDLTFDFGESLYSFQSIIGQSFLPSMGLDTSDSLTKFLDDLQSPPVSLLTFSSTTQSDSVDSSVLLPTPVSSTALAPPSSSLHFKPATSIYSLTDLEDNLVRLFFSHLSMKIFAFHEPYFIANLYPTNKHPSHVIFAICAVTCLFSDHKDILKYGTTKAACAEYTAKCMKEIESFEKICELDYDSLEVVQSLMLLALVEYGFNQPVRAYRKMVLAIQMAIRLKIDQEDPNIAMNPLSIWVDKTQFYSPDKLLVRRKLWEFCLYFDTCIGLAGGLPLVIYEAAYIYLLSPPSNLDAEARVDAASPGKMNSHERAKLKKLKELLVKDRTRTSEGMKTLSEIIQNPPKETVFSSLNLPIKPRPEVQYDQYHVIMNQLSFILRRVIRVNYTVRTSLGKLHSHHSQQSTTATSSATMNPGKNIVESLIPPPQDVVGIHDALVDFYHVLPVEYKPFHSFAQFFPILNNSKDHPKFAEKFDPTRSHVISILTNIISAFVLLHLPRTDDTRAIFKLDSVVTGYKKVCSAEVVLSARKAMVFLVQGILPPQPSATDDDASPGTPQSQDSVIKRSGSGGGHPLSPAFGDLDCATEKSSSMQSLADHHVEPTFATRADQTVHAIVGHCDSELGLRRSRKSLTDLLEEEPPATEHPLSGSGSGSSRDDRQKACDSAREGANVSLFCDPVVGFNIFTIAVAGIAVCTGGSNEEFNRGVLTILETSIEKVDLPVMDCITYIWPVCGSFSERLKRILQVAKRKLRGS